MKQELLYCFKTVLIGIVAMSLAPITIAIGSGIIFKIIAGVIFILGVGFLGMGLFSIYLLFKGR